DKRLANPRVLATRANAGAALAPAPAPAPFAVPATVAGMEFLVMRDAEVDAPTAVDGVRNLLRSRYGHAHLFAWLTAAVVAGTVVAATGRSQCTAPARAVGHGNGQPARKSQPAEGGKDSGHG